MLRQEKRLSETIGIKKAIKPIDITLAKKNHQQTMKRSTDKQNETKQKRIHSLAQSKRLQSPIVGLRKPLLQNPSYNQNQQNTKQHHNKITEINSKTIEQQNKHPQYRMVSSISYNVAENRIYDNTFYDIGSVEMTKTVRPKVTFSMSERQSQELMSYRLLESKQQVGNVQIEQRQACDLRMIPQAKYTQLEERLERCMEQIEVLEENNGAERVLQLENQISMLKQSHQEEKARWKSEIQSLKVQRQRLFEAKKQKKSIYTQTEPVLIKENQNETVQQRQLSRQKQIQQLKQKVYELNTQSIVQPTTRRGSVSLSFQSGRQSVDLQSSLCEIEILRRKFGTLEQVLLSKKREIVNKDEIIKVLMKEKLQNYPKRGNSLSKEEQSERRNRIQVFVEEMFGWIDNKIQQL